MSAFPSGDDLLTIFVKAERAAGQPRSRFRVNERRTGALVRHPGIREAAGTEHAFMRCNLQDLQDLAASGLIRLDQKKQKMPSTATGGQKTSYTMEWWEFDVTATGFERIEGLARTSTRVENQLPGLEWAADVLPVLEAAYALTGGTDPREGVLADDVSVRLGREPNDADTGRVLLALADADYLVPTIGDVSGRVGPQAFRLSERALQLVAGWPTPGSGEDFVKQMVAVLEERISGAQGEERTRLERLRDNVLGVGHDVFVAVVVDAAKRLGAELY